MEQQKKLLLTLELVFWVVTAVIAFGILRPIVVKIADFPFLWQNGFAIVIFVTYTRYAFLWKYNLLSNSLVTRLIFVFSSIPLVFYLVQNLNGFQGYIDDFGYDSFMNLLKKPIADLDKVSLLKYIRSEFVFFSTGAILSAILLTFRMIMSIWRSRNKKGV